MGCQLQLLYLRKSTDNSLHFNGLRRMLKEQKAKMRGALRFWKSDVSSCRVFDFYRHSLLNSLFFTCNLDTFANDSLRSYLYLRERSNQKVTWIRAVFNIIAANYHSTSFNCQIVANFSEGFFEKDCIQVQNRCLLFTSSVWNVKLGSWRRGHWTTIMKVEKTKRDARAKLMFC